MKRHVTVDGRSAQVEIDGSRLRYTREDGVVVEGEFSLTKAHLRPAQPGRSYPG